MSKQYKGAVFFDVDGTLIDTISGIYKPTDATKQALKVLRDNGYLLGIATGRAKHYLCETDIDFDAYICCNGSVAETKDELIFMDCFDTEKFRQLVEYMNKNNFGYCAESYTQGYYSKACEKKIFDVFDTYDLPKDFFMPMPQNPDDIKAVKAMAAFDDFEEFNTLCEKFKDYFLIAKHRGSNSADISRIGVTKALGVNAVVEHFNIDLKNTYAFGDGDNDKEMLSVVSHGIAMGKHAKSLDDIAEYITDTVKDDGIYKALKYFNLI